MTEQTPKTYTTAEAMQALDITARSAFHYLRAKFPKAFIVVKAGTGRFTPTEYDKAAMDEFIKWRAMLKNYNHYRELVSKYKEG